MTAAQYSRRITSIERGYLNAATQGDNPIISFVIEGRGRLDPQELERAIVVTSRANPGLSVARKGKLWLGTGEPPALEVHTTGAGEEWTDHPFLHTPLDLVHGPVASVGLISDGHVDRLVIRVSHAVADGRGIERWTDDLFRLHVDRHRPVLPLQGTTAPGPRCPVGEPRLASALTAGRRAG